MKDGLIRLTDEKDIFYDSIEKIFRYRMHCPNCGATISMCRCYFDLDRLLDDIDDDIADYTCSSKCALLLGEWDELPDAMQEAGFEKDLNECLNKLTDEQLRDELEGCSFESIANALIDKDSNIPISHLKHPSREEQLEILKAMGDLKDVLWNNDIDYYPDIKELTEEQAKKVLEILTEDDDFDYPGGEDCTI